MTDEIYKIKEIAKKAGDAIMEVYNSSDGSSDMGVTYKDDPTSSPLTKADLAANKIIKEGLESIDSTPLLSEEIEAADYSVRKEWSRFWLVDPLDGTKEFIKKGNDFTVNIALIENGEPVMGVVYAPVLDVFYLGEKGRGAVKINGEGEVEIKAGNYKEDGLKIVASKSHRSPELEEFISKLGESECVSMGSSLKLCLIAEGAANLYPRLGPTMEWDTGAAHAVVSAAGGRVTDFEGNDLVYNKEDLHNPHFIVTGSPAFDWKSKVN